MRDDRRAAARAAGQSRFDHPARGREPGRRIDRIVIAAKEFYDLASGIQSATPIFTGLLAYDQFTVFFRLFLITFVILVTALTALSGIPDLEDGPDFYTLLFGATIGMLLMAQANNLLILFLGVEMASVPSYAMVGFLKGASSRARRR